MKMAFFALLLLSSCTIQVSETVVVGADAQVAVVIEDPATYPNAPSVASPPPVVAPEPQVETDAGVQPEAASPTVPEAAPHICSCMVWNGTGLDAYACDGTRAVQFLPLGTAPMPCQPTWTTQCTGKCEVINGQKMGGLQ